MASSVMEEHADEVLAVSAKSGRRSSTSVILKVTATAVGGI
jgi:hypothetical protein